MGVGAMPGGTNAKTGSAGATDCDDDRARTRRPSASIAHGGSTASYDRLRDGGGAGDAPTNRRGSIGEAVGVGYAVVWPNMGGALVTGIDHTAVGETERPKPVGWDGDGGVGGRYGVTKWSRNRVYSAPETVRRKSRARR